MNSRQLEKIGIPEPCVRLAMKIVQEQVKVNKTRGKQLKKELKLVADSPISYVQDEVYGQLARELIEERNYTPPKPISYETWGKDIDEAAHGQLKKACTLPGARAAALMPDAHLGYGLPIGGVLAMEDAVIPYAVGVDIACRMKLSVLDIPVERMTKQSHDFRISIEKGTRFGVGVQHEKPQQHSVMDEDWSITRTTRERKDTAWKQLGTSGSGNHFVEYGVLTLTKPELGLEPGDYVALLSHSGSRGAGASVCNTYSKIARSKLAKRHEDFAKLAWLDINSEEGTEYWNAMTLMGKYAEANHAVIHRLVSDLVGGRIIAGVENHHNFAWKEEHFGKELIVHRKGATPAGENVLGVIPGTMADPAYVVRGKGHPDSLNSASHGAGRCMSRTKAKEKYRWKAVKNDLESRGIQVLSAGADEVPGVYKNINEVMQAQEDLVEIVARFQPKIVKMCGDGSRAED
jgi:tRNA-splicing ligase RtcB (3'-phosphate/5'-hydroxy nucleic acid ligase)